MFFTPARHLAAGQDLGEIVAGLTEGIARAEAATGVRCALIGDMDRAYGPGAGLELVEALGELRRAGRAERVIGIGGDSTELGVDFRAFQPALPPPGATASGARSTPARPSGPARRTSRSPSTSWARSGSTTGSRSSRTRSSSAAWPASRSR